MFLHLYYTFGMRAYPKVGFQTNIVFLTFSYHSRNSLYLGYLICPKSTA